MCQPLPAVVGQTIYVYEGLKTKVASLPQNYELSK